MRHAQVVLWIVYLLLGTHAASSGAVAKEGFGMKKAAVQLTRVRPPEVLIRGDRIAVRSSGQGQGGSFEGQLIAALESELLGNDSRFRLDSTNPQTLVELALLDHSYDERWENRRMTKRVRTGTNSEGKAQYSSREVTVRYKVVTQVTRVAVKVSDLEHERTLLADTDQWTFEDDFQEGQDAPMQSQLRLMASNAMVGRIAGRLAPSREQIGVLVPKGSFKDYINLANAGLWNRYLEALESRPPLPVLTDEAYRQYGLGVAYEALGYAAEDPAVTLNYLEQAALHYNAAINGHPGEKLFTKAYSGSFLANLGANVLTIPGRPSTSRPKKRAMAPLERVQTALEQYQRSIDFAQQLTSTPADGAKSSDLGEAGAKAESEVVDNRAVIEMARAGLPDDIILTTLETAPSTDFDTSPQGLIQLAKGQVSTEIIAKIQTLTTTTSDE